MNEQHDFSVDPVSLEEMMLAQRGGWLSLTKCAKCGCYKIMKGIMPGDTVYKRHFQWNPFKVLKEPPPCTG